MRLRAPGRAVTIGAVGLPSRSYLICANQRSGSTLLCRALSDTGIAGHPDEYFLTGAPGDFPAGWKFWEDGPLAVRHGVTGREAFLRLVHEVGSTPNGVFGAKLMWNNVPWVLARFRELPRYADLDRAEIFRLAFPRLRAVRLTRRDRVRQAVSWLRAAQDGVWVVSDDEPARPAGQPAYDFTVIAAMEALIAEGEREWHGLLAELGIEPCEVVYEDLVSPDGYGPAVRGVLGYLGLDASRAEVPRPRTTRQAGHLSDEWAERFRRERAGRAARPAVSPPRGS
jgi:LPS sulfotransferase NodH